MHLNIGSPREGGGDNNNDNSPLDKRHMQNRNLTWTKKKYRI
jgi:hypothetical protein